MKKYSKFNQAMHIMMFKAGILPKQTNCYERGCKIYHGSSFAEKALFEFKPFAEGLEKGIEQGNKILEEE